MLKEWEIVELLEIATNNMLDRHSKWDYPGAKCWKSQVVLILKILDYEPTDEGSHPTEILEELKKRYPKP